jgi:tetratricopeptide (TPR) repeat protein
MASLNPNLEALLREGRWELLRTALDAALTSARHQEDRTSLAELLSVSSMVHAVLGHQSAALAAAQESLAIRRSLNQALETARALSGLAAAKADQEGPRSALGHFCDALEAYRPLEEVAERCHAALALAGIQLSLGKTREARDVADEAIAWCTDDTLAWCRWTLLEVKADAFRADEALPQALACREQAFLLRQRENAVSASSLRGIADLYRALDRIWEAEQMFQMAREFAREESGASRKNLPLDEPRGLPRGLDPKRGRVTLPGLRLPGWERSH